MNTSLALLFANAPDDSIPTIKHYGAYVTLELLADGELHSRKELTKILGETWRSALQSLRGDRFHYWLIHSVKQADSKTTLLQLDPRHLSGNSQQDAAARLERRKELKSESYKEAEQGWRRMPKAHSAMLEAEKDYFLGLGEAVNDSLHGGPHDE